MSDLPDKSAATDTVTTKEIAAELGPYLRPDVKQQGLQVAAMMVRKFHSGPLPPPDDLADYDRVLPGAAERIFQLAEREQAHRHVQEAKMVRHEYAGRYVGQAGALTALVVGFGAVVYCASIGQPITAAVIGAVGAIVLGFLKYTAARQGRNEEPQKPQPKAKSRRKR